MGVDSAKVSSGGELVAGTRVPGAGFDRIGVSRWGPDCMGCLRGQRSNVADLYVDYTLGILQGARDLDDGAGRKRYPEAAEHVRGQDGV